MVANVTVGRPMKRIDAPPRLTGQEQFTSDLRLPGLLHARPVGSDYAHAKILGVNKEPALAIPGVVAVLTYDDLPLNHPEGGPPIKVPMASDEALHAGQFIAIVLAETEMAAEDGAAAVEIDYEPLEPVVTLAQGMSHEAPKTRQTAVTMSAEEAAMHNSDAATAAEENDMILPHNVSNSIQFTRGDIEQGFAEADEIVEFAYDSLTVHQGYIEPQVCLVSIEPLGNLKVYTSTQAAFYCRSRVADAVGLPLQEVDVVPMPVGGGFGGKFVLLEPLVAALAKAVGRPVLFAFTRMEDFLSGNPAPHCRIEARLGAKKDGTFTALSGKLTFDTGSGNASPLQISAILFGGYYRFPHLDIQGHEVLTNKPGAGAYRAPGAQQGTFAIESTVDEMARKLGMDPLELRLKNCVVEGDLRPNGGAWPKIGLREVLEALQSHPAWQERDKSHAAGRGVGIAVGGWPGGVEPATAICRLDADGRVTVVLGSVDLSGTNTTFAQIAGEAFGVSGSEVQVTTASTAAAPYAGGTGGSKITYTVGPAVQKAAEDARRQILDIASQHLEAAVEDLEIEDGLVKVKGVPNASVSLKEIASISMSASNQHNPVFGTGSSSITESAPGFAGHLAEVEVDELTGETRVTRYVAVQDVGFAINPASVDAQIHGGVAQGIGWALYEGMSYDSDGQLQTATLMDYALPKAAMIPTIETVHVEVASEHGAYGSKGIGEPCAVPGAAAVGNAIRDATGIRMNEIPMRPEALAKRLWAANGK